MSNSASNGAALLAVGVLAACESSKKSPAPQTEPDAPKAAATPLFVGKFRADEGMDTEAIAALNKEAEGVVSQVLKRRELEGKATVELGKSAGLSVHVTVDGKEATRDIPPSTFPAELVSNFDHTLDRALQEASARSE